MSKKGQFRLLTLETVGEGEDAKQVLAPVQGMSDVELKNTSAAKAYIKANGKTFAGKTVVVVDLKAQVKVAIEEVQPKVTLQDL